MKKINIIGTGLAFFLSMTFLTGCSDQFLQDKKDYRKANAEIYNNFEGAQSRVDNLYALMLPISTGSVTYDNVSAGSADDQSKCTEEYGGLVDFIDPNVIINTSTVPDYFYNEQKTSRNPYGRIRNCNDVIAGVTGSTLKQEQKELLLGQAYFFRAWCYLRLVRFYGGVPLVKERQDVIVGDDDGLSLTVPRSSAKECIDFICADLELAAKYLPARANKADLGRVTSGTALALQGRARLLYASPVFNRADNKERWEEAYQSNKAAINALKEGGFGLAYLDATENTNINASNWSRMLTEAEGNPEAVFITLYNNVIKSGSTNMNKNNGWEQAIRPSNAYGGGGKTPTANIIDLFPMADGKKPGKSSFSYEPNTFMLNRDPRFYRTFAFPGVKWAFSGDPTGQGIAKYPYTGGNYVLWNYAWYDTKDNLEKANASGYGADGLANNYKGVYVRKRTDDYDLNSGALYKYDVITSTTPFAVSAAPYMDMRYAEVLLNFAESACGAEHYDEAIQALQDIRKRAGYTASKNYGLDSDLSGNRAKLFEAILYERQIELAYEGKRYDDMHRWMLWDGGKVAVAGQPATWNLTGFSGNTCAYLGVEPMNGKRRDGLELRVADNVAGYLADPKPENDPLKNSRPAAWDLRTDKAPNAALEEFYRTKLTRKTRSIDPSDRELTFKPYCYFLGLKESAQKNNRTLLQTIGWDDMVRGGAGTFDPLAE